MADVIPVTQARRDLLKLVDKVNEEYTRIDLTKHGKVKAILISPDYLDVMEETNYTLKNSMKDIREAEKRFKKGQYVTLEEIKKKLKRNAR